MTILFWISLAVMLLSGAWLAYQDFRTRLISLWLLLLFGAANISYYISEHSFNELLSNSLFCLTYLLFLYLVLHLYYFFRTGGFQRLLDQKIGWGDVCILLLLGCCMPPEDQVAFFSLGFMAALFTQLLFFRSQRNSALAGMLLLVHFLYLLYGLL